MHITILFGNEQAIIVNPECYLVNFQVFMTKALKKRGIKIEDNDIVELCDSSAAVKPGVSLTQFRSLQKRSYLTNVLQHRNKYVPVILFLDDHKAIDHYRILFSPSQSSEGDAIFKRVDEKLIKLKKQDKKRTEKRQAAAKAEAADKKIKIWKRASRKAAVIYKLMPKRKIKVKM